MTRPGDTVEEITVPLGDPDALVAAASSLKGVSAQLQDASGQVGASPSLMSSTGVCGTRARSCSTARWRLHVSGKRRGQPEAEHGDDDGCPAEDG